MFELPQKTIELKVEDKKYSVSFPKTGQLMDIQSLKVRLLSGQAGAILDAGTMDGNYVHVLSDMEAHFTILCPKMIEDLNVTKISDLDAIDSAKLVKVYVEQFLPWYKEWREILQNGGVPEDKKEKKKEEKTTTPAKKETPQISTAD